MTRSPWRSSLICGALLMGMVSIPLSLAPPADARIIQITITSTQSPTFGGTSFGAVGRYEKLIGRVTGEVDPNDPRNAVIVDIQNAPKNGRGMVEYSTDILILRPINASKGSRRLIYDVTNRGNISGFPILNSSNTGNNPTTAADAGNGYLMRQGHLILLSGWDFSAPPGGGRFLTTVPVATNPDGSPITGLNSEELVVDIGAPPPTTLPLTYPAASLDQSKASLTMRRRYTDPPVVIPASGWAYVNATTVRLVPGPFQPTNLYEFTYPAMNPVVGGLGYAAIRDLAAFLRDAAADAGGHANPLAGLVDLIYSICSSQPCRTMRDFVALGFNEADSGPGVGSKGKGHSNDGKHLQVFDGVLNWKGGGSGLFLNYRFAQPVRTHRQHIARWTPEIQFPFTNEMVHDPVTGQTAGRLHRCTTTNTCPKIFEANSSNEFWAKAASNLLTDASGRDLHEIPNVRYYLESSSPHGAANGLGICAQPRNPLMPDEFLRALLVALDEWVSAKIPPPDSRVPHVADGTLVPPLPQAVAGFPQIPGVTYNGVLHTGDLFDFGPRFAQGILDILPPILLGTPYPALVPRTDADGNEIAGVRMPEIAAPVATYTGWNLRANGGGDGCDASGMRIPFPATQADRLATGDPRVSIKERYPTHQAYVDAVTAAANALRGQRFLIDEDVQGYIDEAQASSIGN
jgi:alpha/beta hydrolase family protein